MPGWTVIDLLPQWGKAVGQFLKKRLTSRAIKGVNPMKSSSLVNLSLVQALARCRRVSAVSSDGPIPAVTGPTIHKPRDSFPTQLPPRPCASKVPPMKGRVAAAGGPNATGAMPP
jgi:hypothetical protein